jgi:hypothetical protein
MKKFGFLIIVGAALLFSCKKSDSRGGSPGPIPAGLVGNWQLVQVYGFIGPSNFVDTPKTDSTVLLTFGSDGIYSSLLNDRTVCQGNFSARVDSFYPGWSFLQLTKFKTTGVLWSITEYVDINGHIVLSDSSGIYMNISHDTLNLSPDFFGYDAHHFFVFLKR